MAGWRLHRQHGRQLTLRQLETPARAEAWSCVALAGRPTEARLPMLTSPDSCLSTAAGVVPMRQPRFLDAAAASARPEERVLAAGWGQWQGAEAGLGVPPLPGAHSSRVPLGERQCHAVDPAVVECLNQLRQGLGL